MTPEMNTGTVASVRGAVIDVVFPEGTLPSINTALSVDWDRSEPLALEVHSHLDPRTVRAIALQATGGLRRGTRVSSSGKPICVPVGDALLGRLLESERSRCGAPLGPAAAIDPPVTAAA